MTSTQTKSRPALYYLGMFMALAMLAAILLAAEPSYAAGTTFTVDSAVDGSDADQTDNVCDADVSSARVCTLRAAIEQANTNNNPEQVDRINFNIPGTGVRTISPNSELPEVIEQVTIDGYSQPGASPNTKAVGTNAKLLVQLAGTNAGEFTNGLTIDAPNSVVRGLVINRFGDGIVVKEGSNSSKIEGNFIGTDPSGTIDRGNEFQGVFLFFNSAATTVGGTSPASRNLISGNDGVGVKIFVSTNNVVLGNLIGTRRDGTGTLGNADQGVDMFGSSVNAVGDGSAAGANTIAFNGRDGIAVEDDTSIGNAISRNSIFSNGGLGIDLIGPGEDSSTNVSTPNDGDNPNTPQVDTDGDSGPNGLQNYPVLTSARNGSGKTTITGKISGRPNSGFDVQFYSNPGGNEGKKFIGEKFVRADASGNASFTFTPSSKVAAGQTLTATARSVNLDASFGDTSEFSAPRKVVAL